jgi:hypothetical protein
VSSGSNQRGDGPVDSATIMSMILIIDQTVARLAAVRDSALAHAV